MHHQKRAQRDTCERSTDACYCVFGAAAPPQRLARGRRGVPGGDQGAPDQSRHDGEWECHGGGRWQG